jgi:hypothetical protein
VVASAFEATTANMIFGYAKMQFNFDGSHANFFFAREFDKAAHSCF